MTLENMVREALRVSPDFELLDSHGPAELEEWDSLAHATIMLGVESEYSVVPTIEEVVSIETLGDLREFLKKNGVGEDS